MRSSASCTRIAVWRSSRSRRRRLPCAPLQLPAGAHLYGSGGAFSRVRRGRRAAVLASHSLVGARLSPAPEPPGRADLSRTTLGSAPEPAESGATYPDGQGNALATWLVQRAGPAYRSYGRCMEVSPILDAARPTPRELEVLELLAVGASNRRIARELGVSEHTVKFHLRSIFRTFGVSNRTQAATAYVRSIASHTRDP
jgi:DNA-binding CsgD family transcriptional regulator